MDKFYQTGRKLKKSKKFDKVLLRVILGPGKYPEGIIRNLTELRFEAECTVLTAGTLPRESPQGGLCSETYTRSQEAVESLLGRDNVNQSRDYTPASHVTVQSASDVIIATTVTEALQWLEDPRTATIETHQCKTLQLQQ